MAIEVSIPLYFLLSPELYSFICSSQLGTQLYLAQLL
jgi:hypothetical protein